MCNTDLVTDTLYLGNKGRHLKPLRNITSTQIAKPLIKINDRGTVNKSSIFSSAVQNDHKTGQHL